MWLVLNIFIALERTITKVKGVGKEQKKSIQAKTF
jgi:hypothetical protein